MGAYVHNAVFTTGLEFLAAFSITYTRFSHTLLPNLKVHIVKDNILIFIEKQFFLVQFLVYSLSPAKESGLPWRLNELTGSFKGFTCSILCTPKVIKNQLLASGKLFIFMFYF